MRPNNSFKRARAAHPAHPIAAARARLTLVIEADRITVLGQAPELVNTPSESGNGQIIARCPTCRIAVWSHYAGAGPLVSGDAWVYGNAKVFGNASITRNAYIS